MLWHPPLLRSLYVTWETDSWSLLLFILTLALLPFSPGLYALACSQAIQLLEPAYVLDLLPGTV